LFCVNGGFARLVRFRKKSFASNRSSRWNSKTLPRHWLVPDLIVVLMIAALRPNSAPKVDRWILTSWIASMLGRIPAFPNRALRVSMPFTRKLLFDSRPPAMESVVSPRPVQLEAGDTPMPMGVAPAESWAS
jgi:hypothetical protein